MHLFKHVHGADFGVNEAERGVTQLLDYAGSPNQKAQLIHVFPISMEHVREDSRCLPELLTIFFDLVLRVRLDQVSYIIVELVFKSFFHEGQSQVFSPKRLNLVQFKQVVQVLLPGPL